MMSLVCSHLILFFHRRVVYGKPEKEPATSICSEARVSSVGVVMLLVTGIALHVVGCSLHIYEVTSERGGDLRLESYSIIRIGSIFPSSALDSANVGVRWIQAMYFFLAVALPILNSLLFALLYLVPWNAQWREIMFLATEINFAWSSIEVLTVSTIFSILQIPEFGNGLIDAGCEQCYVVGSKMLPTFAVLCVATVVNLVVNIWLYGKAHKVLYPHKK